jgi:hypothetical protein
MENIARSARPKVLNSDMPRPDEGHFVEKIGIRDLRFY